jgi:hypothetical protein
VPSEAAIPTPKLSAVDSMPRHIKLFICSTLIEIGFQGDKKVCSKADTKEKFTKLFY